MTDKEKAIVMAYTGIAMLTGDKFDIFHRYIQEKLGRPIWTHELASEEIWAQIKEATKEDFTRLCKEEDDAIPTKWIKNYASHKASKDLIDCYWHFWEDDVLKMIEEWRKENAL